MLRFFFFPSKSVKMYSLLCIYYFFSLFLSWPTFPSCTTCVRYEGHEAEGCVINFLSFTAAPPWYVLGYWSSLFFLSRFPDFIKWLLIHSLLLLCFFCLFFSCFLLSKFVWCFLFAKATGQGFVSLYLSLCLSLSFSSLSILYLFLFWSIFLSLTFLCLNNY